MDMADNKTVGKRPYGVHEDISGNRLDDVLHKFRAVGLDAFPLLCVADSLIGDGVAAELVCPHPRLHIAELLKIEELETAIEKNREQKQVLTNLMASGYLEPALFNKESNELAAEAETLRQEKDRLMRSVNGDMVKVEELQRLLRFTSKGNMLTEFDDAIFLSFVERITVLSRKEAAFELKCGLSLRERLVEP